MAQNYKVFVDGNSLSFLDCKENKPIEKESTHYESLTDLMKVENIFKLSQNCESYSNEPKEEFRAFKKHYHAIKAAGGIVEFDGKYLFIKRLGKWDLPKGKVEPNEKKKVAALREIEEECHIFEHYIVCKICNTYHTYAQKDQLILKKTSWFYLKIDQVNLHEIKPQVEEGITEVRWFGIDEFEEVRQNTFDSIHIVLAEFLKIKQLK